MAILKSEMMATANWTWGMYPGLSKGCINTLLAHGSDQLKKDYLPELVEGKWTGTMRSPSCSACESARMYSCMRACERACVRACVNMREWTGTMCLTEPQCGSDLAQVKTKATPAADGTYKVFHGWPHVCAACCGLPAASCVRPSAALRPADTCNVHCAVRPRVL